MIVHVENSTAEITGLQIQAILLKVIPKYAPINVKPGVLLD